MALITKTFNGAHTFYVDPSIVGGNRSCDISYINLYFKHKPDLFLNTNDGARPGVVLSIAETMYDVPRITRESGVFTGKNARLALADVITSSDATAPSTFRFAQPFTVETDKSYCFVFEYDLSGAFELWTSVQGEILTGSTSISPGPSDKFIGKYYTFNTLFTADDNTNLDEYIKSWRPVSDTTLKFDIGIARYSHGGVPVFANNDIANDDIIQTVASANVTANTTGRNFNVNFGSYEFVSFDENQSSKSAYIGGQMAYQNTVFYPGGVANGNTYVQLTTVSGNATITANTQLPDGSDFNWNTIFPADNAENRIVVTNGEKTNIRTVGSIVSNTILTVTEEFTFSNTDTKLMITPTARVSSLNKSSPFGVDAAFVMLANSAANSTVRFVNNQVVAATITGGGSGYSNDDVFYLTGFEHVPGAVTGGYVAVANLSTNSTGGIESLYFSNLGAGFTNSTALLAQIANSTGNSSSNSSAGSGATFTYNIGANIKTEYGNTSLHNVEIRNIDMGEFVPYHTIYTPPGVNYSLKLETNYIKKANTSVYGNEAYYVNDGVSNNQLSVVMYDINSSEYLEETPVIPSKSNEFGLLYEDGSPNDKITNAASRSSQSIVMVTDTTSNSDWSTIRMDRPSIQFSKYIINNDATDEHTDSGNAHARGLTTVVDFKRTSEDLRLYATCYKPSNTDIKFYARIYKNEDPDAFDDKNWTELELKDGFGLISSSADALDYVQLEYGFHQIPQDRTRLNGSVQIASGDATITGSGTDFSTDLAAGDLVYMYQPLFVENHLVAAVSSVTNATSFEMDTTTANTSLLAEGMNIEKITLTEQAFNNKQNNNMVRYYNGSTSKFDGYEHIAIKAVLLSSNPHRIPRIDDWNFTAVSA